MSECLISKIRVSLNQFRYLQARVWVSCVRQSNEAHVALNVAGS